MSARETLEVLYLTQWRAGNAEKIQLGSISKVIKSVAVRNVKFILRYCCLGIKVKTRANQTANPKP